MIRFVSLTGLNSQKTQTPFVLSSAQLTIDSWKVTTEDIYFTKAILNTSPTKLCEIAV